MCAYDDDNVRHIYVDVSQSVLMWTSQFIHILSMRSLYCLNFTLSYNVHIDSFQIKLKMLLAKRRRHIDLLDLAKRRLFQIESVKRKRTYDLILFYTFEENSTKRNDTHTRDMFEIYRFIALFIGYRQSVVDFIDKSEHGIAHVGRTFNCHQVNVHLEFLFPVQPQFGRSKRVCPFASLQIN